MMRLSLQQRRFALQLGFFALFVLAPVLNLLRFDLTRGHAYLLGFDWTLGLSGFVAGEVGTGTVALNLLLRGLLPILLVGGGLLYVAWRWGRLYCGWLCPHFSVVETINGLMRRAIGRPSLWERKPLPALEPDGTRLRCNPWYWLPTLAAVLGFAFLWAVVLLTYLLPPTLVYGGLISGTLARGPTLFILIATLAFTIEFMFARHLFCRFGCAVGLFQSLAWMANDRAMVVGFDGARADACHDCNNACDNVCPMRLRPRTLKRRMFTCTECAQCISACGQVQAGGLGDARLAASPQQSLLRWVEGADALAVVTGRPGAQVEPQQVEPVNAKPVQMEPLRLASAPVQPVLPTGAD
ncbi:MAG: 4Fe-4S binding protein [Chromatiaceae bacterium]|nr:4Fe-4S binding protein [Chromatiaceae bacterium]